MPVIAIIGAQWGDEGKGKIVDLLAEQADMVMRFSGGDNAGHTVVNQLGKFALHLVPSGIFSPKAVSVIGNGVVVNPRVLFNELDELRQRNVDTSRLYISDRAHLVMPYHILLDGLEEEARGGKAIGTTRKGIGPAFADKAARLGIRTSDLLDRDVFRERLSAILAHKNSILTKVYNSEPLSEGDVYNEYCQYGEMLAPHICDTAALLEKAINDGKDILPVVLLNAPDGLFDKVGFLFEDLRVHELVILLHILFYNHHGRIGRREIDIQESHGHLFDVLGGHVAAAVQKGMGLGGRDQIDGRSR